MFVFILYEKLFFKSFIKNMYHQVNRNYLRNLNGIGPFNSK